jgi:signal transduction histidine kinase
MASVKKRKKEGHDLWHMVFFPSFKYDGLMIGLILHRIAQTHARDLLATLWPAGLPEDSKFQRHRKIAVRSAQLASLALVVVAIAAAAAANFGSLSLWRLAGLVLAGLAYAVWNVIGTWDIVRELLWEPGSAPPIEILKGRNDRVLFFFAIQLGLAGLIYSLLDPCPKFGLLWLILLPPVAHSVILLRVPGISIVSSLVIALFGFFLVRRHGWNLLPTELMAFSLDVLFTLVFTQLAVRSEKARGDMQWLACELSEANSKLRQYAVQAEELAVTRERNRLAREIHDTLGHCLTVVNVQIEAARVMLDRDPARAHDALHKAQAITQEGLRDIRSSVSALRASPLDNKNLGEALRQTVETFCATGLAVEFTSSGQRRVLPHPAELTLFRAAQEGLTNVQKHARAAHARVALDFSQPSKVRLTVSDDGAGAREQSSNGHGFGLLGLRERTLLVKGKLRTRTAPAGGFTLEVEVPG